MTRFQVKEAPTTADQGDEGWGTEAGFATFLATGELDVATENVARWWHRDERARLGLRAQALDLGPESTSGLTIRGAQIQLIRLEGEGVVRYLATFTQAKVVVSPAEHLSARQRRVVELAVLGMMNQEIADQLRLSPNTIKTHLHHVYDLLKVSSRLELIRLMQRAPAG